MAISNLSNPEWFTTSSVNYLRIRLLIVDFLRVEGVNPVAAFQNQKRQPEVFKSGRFG
ncbi:MAG TPA: hypothetical protein VHA06_01100 [Candidatus Angelobacter sp.]|jgi:hypothetical protein|nr:hypothetical protein [Candidatus Angelobacter sp.]